MGLETELLTSKVSDQLGEPVCHITGYLEQAIVRGLPFDLLDIAKIRDNYGVFLRDEQVPGRAVKTGKVPAVIRLGDKEGINFKSGQSLPQPLQSVSYSQLRHLLSRPSDGPTDIPSVPGSD